MAEFLVDKLLNALDDVVITMLLEFKLVTGFEEEVNNLASKLRIIRGMLQDAQIRKLKEKPVGIWLEKLEDVAYDADDVLDEWNTEFQKLESKAEEDSDFLSQDPQPAGVQKLEIKAEEDPDFLSQDPQPARVQKLELKAEEDPDFLSQDPRPAGVQKLEIKAEENPDFHSQDPQPAGVQKLKAEEDPDFLSQDPQPAGVQNLVIKAEEDPDSLSQDPQPAGVQKLKIKAEEDPDFLSQEPQSKRIKVLSSLLSSSIGSVFKRAYVGRDIAQKIKVLNDRINTVVQEANELKFVTTLSSASQDNERASTTSLVDEPEVYARESNEHAIVSKLLSSTDNTDDHGDGIHIVSIVGMGGIGKTTLAQRVFSDNRVKDHFQVKKWICVSGPFDQKRIVRAILSESSPDMSELETLLQRLKASISKKKFLLVLDDAWTVDCNDWKSICNSLKDGDPGSRILVTTRDERVARMVGTNYLHQLFQLSDLDCWKILSRIAFLGRSENERVMFAGIGMKISKKCAGLPLAANFLGSLLRSKDTVEEWKSVLESGIWELEEATTGLFPHIYLSYNELSPEMKRCFLYCAVFPKASEILVEDLIRQWMAHGYLNSSSSTRRVRDLESRGYEYFTNLAKRSFFQNFQTHKINGKIYSCKMHDIVHDFAQYLTHGECIIIENLEDVKQLSWEKVRHLAWSCGGGVEVNSMVSNVEKVRSFYCDCVASVGLEIFYRLKCVRALRLCRVHLEEVPKAIGKLKHLRYLDLSDNSFKEFPEEICELYNLETLNVSRCSQLTQFPEMIWNLKNLRHLLNSGTTSFKQFPPALEKLTSLQTLHELKVGNGYSKLEYLRNLNQLRDCLRIDFYEIDEIDFESAKLSDKIHMESLVLHFESSRNDGVFIRGEQAPTPPNMLNLTLVGYPNTKLPSRMMSLDNLVRLSIYGGNVTSLPTLGKLPSLERLEVLDLKDMEFLGCEVLGITKFNIGSIVIAFPKLKALGFYGLSNLRIWEDLTKEDENNVACDVNIMPCLQVLSLYNCNKLEMLPHGILHKTKSLKRLTISGCDGLKKRYAASATEWIYISHIPRVEIDRQIMKFSNSQPSI